MINMLTHITKHEIRRNFRDGRSRSLVLVTFFILTASLLFSFREYQLASIQYEQNIEQLRINWEQQSEKDPHDAAHDGTYVVKPIHPLNAIDKGIQPFSGSVVHLGAHQRKQSALNEAKDQSGVFRFGELTPSFVLTYIIPLLLIFLGFNTFTEENDKQTLRLLLVQGVSKKSLVLGKWLALLIQMMVLWGSFFVATVIGALSTDTPTPVNGIELLYIGAIYLLYFIIFINLIVWISSKAKSSGGSLTILITIWIMFTLVAPKLVTNFASWKYPFPTLQTFKDNINKDQESGLNGHNFWNDAAISFKQKVLEEYGVETVEELPLAYGGLLLAEGEKYESEIFTKHFNLLQNQYRKQKFVYQLGSLFSPMLPVRFVSMGISKTDYDFLWHFEDQAEKYRVEFNTLLNMNIAENAKGIDKYTAGKELWRLIPRFEYQWQNSEYILRNHSRELGILFLWAIVSFFVTVFNSRKIRIT
jgi:ABC-2 type transport system permease protein